MGGSIADEDGIDLVDFAERENAAFVFHNKIAAARKIQKRFRQWQDRVLFKQLKVILRRAETTLSVEALKQLSPQEALLLSDPTSESRIRFRFGGTSFPPDILFKIFTSRNTVRYYCGKNMIQGQALADAQRMMGNRKFRDQMVRDLASEHLEDFEVATMKDYMKHLSTMDASAACVGGRGNGWRSMTFPEGQTLRQGVRHEALGTARRRRNFEHHLQVSMAAAGQPQDSVPSGRRPSSQPPAARTHASSRGRGRNMRLGYLRRGPRPHDEGTGGDEGDTWSRGHSGGSGGGGGGGVMSDDEAETEVEALFQWSQDLDPFKCEWEWTEPFAVKT